MGVHSIAKLRREEKIVSCSDWDHTLRVWDTTTYQCVSILTNVNCANSNGILDMGSNTILVGGTRKILRVDIRLATVETVVDESMGNVFALLKLNDDTVLCGSDNGKIFLYDNIHKSICNEEQCPLYNFRFRR